MSVQYQLLTRVILAIHFLHIEEIVRVKISVCFEMTVSETYSMVPDLGPNTLKSIQIHYSYFDLSMITFTGPVEM